MGMLYRHGEAASDPSRKTLLQSAGKPSANSLPLSVSLCCSYLQSFPGPATPGDWEGEDLRVQPFQPHTNYPNRRYSLEHSAWQASLLNFFPLPSIGVDFNKFDPNSISTSTIKPNSFWALCMYQNYLHHLISFYQQFYKLGPIISLFCKWTKKLIGHRFRLWAQAAWLQKPGYLTTDFTTCIWAMFCIYR
jgi:hypothetical protein